MSKHFFSSPFLPAFTKWSTWLFILATILLHIFLLESSAWKDWSPKPVIESAPHITVSLRPESSDSARTDPSTDTPKPVKAIASTPNKVTPAPAVGTTDSAVSVNVQDVPPNTVQQDLSSDKLVTTIDADPKVTDAADTMSTSGLPEFRLRIPETAEMQLEITNTKVNGSPTTGVGSLLWESYNGKYKISIEAGVNLFITTLNLLTITSEGYIDVFGLMPIVSNDIRKNRAATAIHFNHQEKTISFSSSNKVIPMENGAQDAVSVLIQLAAIGYADPTQLSAGKEFSIQVAEGRDATPFLFRVTGEEEIISPLDPTNNKLLTIHITRPPKPGFYNSQLDIWLAPSLGWYPVQIRNTESSGTVTNQRVIALKQKVNLEK
ncbi:DUF3108 domain-containing protein [Undibacterium sp. Ji22W]|uniref:DUF3108 domain-containing protein n=1 Tax=Undibacterium sp. Ji22W TaxID=3413038 RepID=UPI003BF0DB49